MTSDIATSCEVIWEQTEPHLHLLLDKAQETLTLGSAKGLRCPNSPFVTIDTKTTVTKSGAKGSSGFWFSGDQNTHKETGKY